MSGIMINPEKLIEFFDRRQEESCGYGYDISTTDELRKFLSDFCRTEADLGFGIEENTDEKETENKESNTPPFDSITYYDRKSAEKHLELLNNAIKAVGSVSIQDYYRLAEFLEIIPKWTSMYFKKDYGWRDLSSAQINTMRGLWIIEMPVPVCL